MIQAEAGTRPEEGLRFRPTATRSAQAVIRSRASFGKSNPIGLDRTGLDWIGLDGCFRPRQQGLHAEAEPCVASNNSRMHMQLQ